MKNIYSKTIFILASIGIIVLSSCEKRLDIQPDTQLTELKTFSDVKSALNGTYAGFKSNKYYDNRSASGTASAWSALPDLMGDDFVEALESLGNWRKMSEMTYASDEIAVSEAYIQPYEIISRANNILKSIDKFENNPQTADEAATIKAQALAIRAHAHFDAMRYFGQDYARNSNLLGVAYVKTFDPLKPFDFKPSRNTVKEDYDNIFADLNASLVSFRKGGNTSNNTARNYIDSAVVYAMRARVNFYASQWDAVIKDVNVVLNLFPVENEAGFVATFSADNEASPSTEVIWAIPSDNTLIPGGATNGSDPNYRVATPIANIIKNQGGAYADENIIKYNRLGIGDFRRTLSWKYSGIKSFKVFRAGEMQLMKAEAKQRLGNPTALTDLNYLRTQRGVSIGTETSASLLDAILLQRRVELIAEGHRWFDLKRTTRSIQRSECGIDDGSSSSNCTIASSSRAWVFPIPFNEIKVNPNLVQNPNY